MSARGAAAEPPVPERCLGAAVLQGLAVVCASTALSDPGWLLVKVAGQSYVYGAAYILHQGFNLTEPGAHQLLHPLGLRLLLLLTTCCYISAIFGLAAFLLDFLGTRYMGVRRRMGILLPPVLHLTTVLSSATTVAVCTYLYVLLYHEVHFQVITLPLNTLSLGESYYFAIFDCLGAIAATGFSFSYARRYQRECGTLTTPTEETSPLLQEPETPNPPGEYG